MLLRIDPKSNVPLYEQIIMQIKELRAKGIILANEKLPSVRELSSQIVINPNTVSKAYKELERQGIIVTIRGKGTFVAEGENIEASEKEREKMKKSLEQLVIDSVYLGITKEELQQWIDDLYKVIGGESDDRN
ncbi:GntR family transcriptional regulator [Alkalihalobacterium elongatum]|uniref:GntR family transcriptional regulator n=1 Tax=Alkalihalobacterium elongatum TaxID=2675466 RepID=UPI001C1F41EF|nr:GntR family transcriptional regulator [Alkalihalobacterium elongatum]